MRARFQLVWNDCWIGLFWRKSIGMSSDRRWFRRLELFLCLIPCLPLVLTFDEHLPMPRDVKKERP